MTGTATTTGSSFSFHDLPSRNFYFRIKTVDKAGHFSPFTRIYTIAERDRHDRQRRHPPEILMQSLLRRPSEEYGRSGSS
jgi:hypothetical protein